MAWGFGRSEKESASSTDNNEVHFPQNYPGAHDEATVGDLTYEQDAVQCPPHTTERKLLARIDMHVIPFLVLLYWLAFLDRVNISNANIFGLSDDLGLEGVEYNTALVIFFVPILFEIPANILMKKFTPHVWLSANMVLFGFVTVMQGLVRNYAGLLATRFFLGVFEAGMFPGCFYLIGMWYKRQEAQKRFSFFFSSTTLAGGFGGLIAAGIGKMDGIGGYENWRWLFIIEGAFTVVCSLLVYFFLSDFPEEAKWLKPSEKAFVAARLRVDQGQSARDHKTTAKGVFKILTEFRVLIAGVMYFGLIVPAYSYAYFAPTIIKGFNFGNPIQTQLYSVPPWAAAFGWSMLTATFSDMSRHRFSFIIGGVCIAIAAFAILITVHDHTQVQYAALFLVAMGCYSTMPFMVCWFNMNIGGHVRRSVCSAWQVSFGNIGGIIAVFAFFPSDAPGYRTGYSICIAFAVLAMIASILYGISCIKENKKRDRMPTDLNLSETQKAELGDLSPEYRYLL